VAFSSTRSTGERLVRMRTRPCAALPSGAVRRHVRSMRLAERCARPITRRSTSRRAVDSAGWFRTPPANRFLAPGTARRERERSLLSRIRPLRELLIGPCLGRALRSLEAERTGPAFRTSATAWSPSEETTSPGAA
jgi:hypothetical protein